MRPPSVSSDMYLLGNSVTVISIICTYIDLVREDGYLNRAYGVRTAVFRRPYTLAFAYTRTYTYTRVRS